MAARPLRRAPDPLPAGLPMPGGYVLALWSGRRPRVYALAGPGRQWPIEVRARRAGGALVVRLSVGGRQVTRTLLGLLRAHAAADRRGAGWVLHSDDGTCAPRSLRWVRRGELTRVSRWGRGEGGAVGGGAGALTIGRPARLSAAAAAVCRSNDAEPLARDTPDV